MIDKTEGRTDEELFLGAGENKTDIEEFLLEKYKPLVRKIAKTESFKISGGDHDDLLQEGMIGLMKAAKSFDPHKGASFFTFAALCIKRQMISAVRASNMDKNVALNSYIPLFSEELSDIPEGERLLIDSLKGLAEKSAEETVIDIDDVRELHRRIHKELSGFEARVYEMYIYGMSSLETAQILGKDKRSIDNALQRIRRKIGRLLKEGRQGEALC